MTNFLKDLKNIISYIFLVSLKNIKLKTKKHKRKRTKQIICLLLWIYVCYSDYDRNLTGSLSWLLPYDSILNILWFIFTISVLYGFLDDLAGLISEYRLYRNKKEENDPKNQELKSYKNKLLEKFLSKK